MLLCTVQYLHRVSSACRPVKYGRTKEDCERDLARTPVQLTMTNRQNPSAPRLLSSSHHQQQCSLSVIVVRLETNIADSHVSKCNNVVG